MLHRREGTESPQVVKLKDLWGVNKRAREGRTRKKKKIQSPSNKKHKNGEAYLWRGGGGLLVNSTETEGSWRLNPCKGRGMNCVKEYPLKKYAAGQRKKGPPTGWDSWLKREE